MSLDTCTASEPPDPKSPHESELPLTTAKLSVPLESVMRCVHETVSLLLLNSVPVFAFFEVTDVRPFHACSCRPPASYEGRLRRFRSSTAYHPPRSPAGD